jgi:EmrB/QacA subfamily drug resistance transporter
MSGTSETSATAPPGGPSETARALAEDDRITPAILKVAGVVVLGSIMAILDMTVVNVALPTFQTEFGVEEYSTVAWTVTAYTLALAAVIPMTGWAADRFGTKRLYMTALALFTAGSVLCSTAWSIESLIAFRVLQGLGGGMLMPLGMTIMTRAAGPHRIGRLMAILGVPMLLGPIIGPILGGWLIDSASWHWIFLINLPLGVAAIIYAFFALTPDSPEPSEKFDVVGMALLSPGLALFLYGVSSIPREGTIAAAGVLIPGLVGLALMAAFVVWAFRPQHPLLDLRLFANRNLTVATVVLFMFAASFFGSMLLVPTYFQQVRGESVLMAGLLVAPQGLGAMVTMPIAGRLVDSYPVGRIVPFGFIAIIIGLTGLALSTDPSTPLWRIIVCLFVVGLGMGGTMMPIFTSALKTLKQHQVARGSTLINVIQQVAASVGVASISVILTNQQNASVAINAVRAIGEAQARGLQVPGWATEIAQRLGDALHTIALNDLAHSFSTSYWVAAGAVLVTFVFGLVFLPRKHEESHLLDDQSSPEAPVLLH